MRIDLLSATDDGTCTRRRRVFRLEDLSGLRTLEVQLPLLPDSVAPWVSRVTIPSEASIEQRRDVLALMRGHAGLRELVLKFGVPSDPNAELRALAQFPFLTALELFVPHERHAEGRSLNLAPVSELHRLRSLHIYGPVLFVDALSKLSELCELEVLQDRDVIWRSLTAPHARVPQRDAVDAAPLRNLRRLRKLALNCVTDLSSLERLEELEELTLDYCDVADLTPLRALRRLRCLSLDHTLVNDLSPLRELPELRELYVGCTAVTDIRPLATCSQLERLSLSRTPVSDLSPLRALPRLEQLELSNGETPDLQQIAGLSNLRALSLANTNVDDFTALKGCERLEVCILDGTPLDGRNRLSATAAFPLISLATP